MKLRGGTEVASWAQVLVDGVDVTNNCLATDPKTGWARLVIRDSAGAVTWRWPDGVAELPIWGKDAIVTGQKILNTRDVTGAVIQLKPGAPADVVEAFRKYQIQDDPPDPGPATAAAAAPDDDPDLGPIAPQQVAGQDPDPPAAAHELGLNIAFTYALWRAIGMAPARAAWLTFKMIARQRLARWLAKKAAPYQKGTK